MIYKTENKKERGPKIVSLKLGVQPSNPTPSKPLLPSRSPVILTAWFRIRNATEPLSKS